MAQFTETRTPYEFLVRWNKEGQIQGAHIGWLDTVLKDGEVLTQTPSNVESVGAEGFPLEEILMQVQIDTLTLINVRNAEILALKAEIEELKKPKEFNKIA